MYNLVADVDVHTRLYIIEGLLEVSGSGRSEVTGITVSLKEREKQSDLPLHNTWLMLMLSIIKREKEVLEKEELTKCHL